jgi:hypothetical protein
MPIKRFPSPDGRWLVQYETGIISHTWRLFVDGAEADQFRLGLMAQLRASGDHTTGGWLRHRLSRFDRGTEFGAVISVHPQSGRMFVAFKLPSESWEHAEQLATEHM